MFFSLMMFAALAQSQMLPSSANEWKDMKVDKVKNGRLRPVLSGPTKTLDHFEIEVKTVQFGTGKINLTGGNNQERFILVKEGNLGVVINGQKQVIGPGSVFVGSAGDQIKLYKADQAQLTYYEVKWDSKLDLDQRRAKKGGGSVAIDYQEMDYQETAKGGRRAIMRRPTGTLEELEMHITTLNEGHKSHDPHTHVDEEIIVILKGEVEELINGIPFHQTTGSVIFLSSMDPHGIRNAGKGQCEYYAIRWLSSP